MSARSNDDRLPRPAAREVDGVDETRNGSESTRLARHVSALEAIAEIRAGRIVIVTDDENRENEGDMILAAEKVSPEAINTLATHARGLICAPMTQERLDALALGPMVGTNTESMCTGFTVSVDYLHGTTTGISASDRAATVRALVDAAAAPSDFARPGHIFPLAAKAGGVLERAGHTEAAVDLARLAGLRPAGVLCEVTNERGEMARGDELEAVAARLGLVMCTIRDLIHHRLRTERVVERVLDTDLPTRHGPFRLRLYRDPMRNEHHLALTMGDVSNGPPPLVRLHSQCLTGDVFGSLRCDCGVQVNDAMARIRAEGRGALLYLDQEGRGIGLVAKLRSYALQDEGLDTVEANVKLGFRPDERDYGTAAQILQDLGADRVRLLTNNPTKVSGLEGYGVAVTERVGLEAPPERENARYLETKRRKLGHWLGGAAEASTREESERSRGTAPSR